jgi:DNA-binding MarR family transcriptional regulator
MAPQNPSSAELEMLHTALSELVKLYQFRNRDEKLYYGVTVAQAYCLRSLWLSGPLSMRDLARAVTVSLSTLTGVVDQLEELGYVRRGVAPADRRSFLVELTPAGRALYEQSNDEFKKRLRKVARKYGSRDLATVRAFLADFGEMVSQWREIPS